MPEMAYIARPKCPPKAGKLKKVDLSLPDSLFDDPDDVTECVRDVEGGRSIPVLLKQYLKLGGKIIGFNVDPGFGDCLDGLILVDLMHSDPKVLSRFMGKDGVRTFQQANPERQFPCCGEERMRRERGRLFPVGNAPGRV